MDDANNKNPQKPKMERAIVARGRSIVVPTEQKRLATYTLEGKPVHVPVLKTVGPDQEVELPAADVAWLRSTGHLVDPRAKAPLAAEGARVTEVSA